jgi:hypothetical protein
MGMEINKARGNNAPFGVDRLGGLFGDVADSDDAPVTNTNVGTESFTTGSVDNGSALDQKIEHLSPPPFGRKGLRTFPILPPINGQRKRQIRRR